MIVITPNIIMIMIIMILIMILNIIILILMIAEVLRHGVTQGHTHTHMYIG